MGLKERINKILSKSRIFFDKTFVIFLLVGVANALCGAGIMFLFYNVFHFGYWFSSFSNYFFGSILSYFLNKHLTFKAKGKSLREILLFATNIAVCYIIAYTIAKPLMLWLLSGSSKVIQENIAMLVGMCIFTALNYIGQRMWVFGKKEE